MTVGEEERHKGSEMLFLGAFASIQCLHVLVLFAAVICQNQLTGSSIFFFVPDEAPPLMKLVPMEKLKAAALSCCVRVTS